MQKNPRGAKRLAALSAISILFLSCATETMSSALQNESDSPSAFLSDEDRYYSEDINGPFPETVTVKTKTQSFNTYHYYALKNGLIWYKGITLSSGPSEWMLFMRTGLPRNGKGNDFRVPRRIIEISADGDELFALSDEGRFYRIVFDKKHSRKNNRWYDNLGWPSASPLLLEGDVASNRGWAIGKRNSSVQYYEDIFGNQHHYGTVGIQTSYVLMADGQEIRFGDVGLPSDFSRTLLGPERGAFIAENISASASTVFLIGAAGEMYTRLADFDTVGCDPMLYKYTYKPYVSKFNGRDMRSVYDPWGLPGEDWRPQPRIPLTGRAAISRHITILQNGKGNGARELRVAGRDSTGESGYWSKPIFGDAWTFVSAPLRLSPDDILHPENFTEGRGPRGPIADVRLGGYLWKDKRIVGGWSFEVPDFNILEGQCTLNISRGAERASIVFHPVEAWTNRSRNTPGRDGTPKPYLGTIEIPEGSLAGLSAESRAELERCFLSGDRELFGYRAEATTDYLLIEPRDRAKDGYAVFLTKAADSTVYPDSFRVARLTTFMGYDRYASEKYAMGGNGPFTAQDLDDLNPRIERNRRLAAELESMIKDFNSTRRRSEASRFAYSAFSLVTHAVLLYRIDFPTAPTREIVKLNDEQVDLIAGTRAWLDGLLLDLVKTRVAAYSSVALQLEGGAVSADMPPGFAESYRLYMSKAGLPAELTGCFTPTPDIGAFRGTMSDGTIRTTLRPTSFGHDFPGWVMEVGDEPSFTVLVELEKLAAKVYARAGTSPNRKPLTLRARLHFVSAGSAERDRELYRDAIGDTAFSDTGVPATVRLDGKELVIKRATENDTRIIFRGLLPSALP